MKNVVASAPIYVATIGGLQNFNGVRNQFYDFQTAVQLFVASSLLVLNAG